MYRLLSVNGLGASEEAHGRVAVLARVWSMLRKRWASTRTTQIGARSVTVTHAHDRQLRCDRVEGVSFVRHINDLRSPHNANNVQVSTVWFPLLATMTHLRVYNPIRSRSRMRGCLVCLMVA